MPLEHPFVLGGVERGGTESRLGVGLHGYGGGEQLGGAGVHESQGSVCPRDDNGGLSESRGGRRADVRVRWRRRGERDIRAPGDEESRRDRLRKRTRRHASAAAWRRLQSVAKEV